MLYLVVAHQTAVSPELAARLIDIAAADANAKFVLLVPSTRVSHLLTWVEGESEEIARRRAAEASGELRSIGLNVVEAVVGPADPLVAIREEHARKQGQYESVIIGTLPAGLSHWLISDLPAKVRRQFDLDVIHVVSGTSGARSESRRESLAAPAAISYPLDLQTLAGWRGRKVHCLDGLLGDLDEVIYDYVSREPLWLGVPSRPLPFRTLLVPAAAAIIEEDHLKVGFAKDMISAEPPVELGEGFVSLNEEEAIYAHFGLIFNELRDVRVLRSRQEMPGLEQNQQRILASELVR